jgi:acetyltransferase
LEEILVSFSNLIVDFPEIREMDLNPIAVSNGKAIAIDARIIIDREGLEYAGAYPHLVITPYPSKYITSWRLPDRTEVLLRPIRPEDEPLERELLSSLSEETMRMRLFRMIKEITHEMLVRFCNIDYDRDIAIVAEIKENEKRRIIGIGRVMREHDLRTGEIGVLVHDEFQGKGLGYKLMETIISIVKEKGIEELRGLALTENTRILKMVREFDFTRQYLPDGVTEIRLKLK